MSGQLQCSLELYDISNVMSETSVISMRHMCIDGPSLGPERLDDRRDILEPLQLEGLRLGLALPSHASFSSFRMPSSCLGCVLLVCAAVCRPCCGRVLPGILALTPVPHVVALNQALNRWAVIPAREQSILVSC